MTTQSVKISNDAKIKEKGSLKNEAEVDIIRKIQLDSNSMQGLGVQEVLDAFPSYILIIDENHYILAANKAVIKDLGVDPKNIIGKFCPKVVHGLDRPFPNCPLEEAVKCRHRVEREIFEPTLQRWLASIIYPIKLKNQEKPKIFLHLVIDINEKKIAKEEAEINYQKLQKTFNDTINAFSGIVELKDPYTSGHQKRVAKLAVAIAEEMGEDKDKIEAIKITALIHDIGKILFHA